jgi:prophage regulatory protein
VFHLASLEFFPERSKMSVEAEKRIARLPEIIRRTGLSRCTIWRLERDEDFPRRVRLSANATGWDLSEVDEWIAARIKARDQSGASARCYLPGGCLPRSIPPGRVLVHNSVGHAVTTASGVNGFRAWTEPEPAGPERVKCECGWSGLLHYRVKRAE